MEYTGEVEEYSVNGVLYSNDDLTLQPTTTDSALAKLNADGAKEVHKLKLDKEYTSEGDDPDFSDNGSGGEIFVIEPGDPSAPVTATDTLTFTSCQSGLCPCIKDGR